MPPSFKQNKKGCVLWGLMLLGLGWMSFCILPLYSSWKFLQKVPEYRKESFRISEIMLPLSSPTGRPGFCVKGTVGGREELWVVYAPATMTEYLYLRLPKNIFVYIFPGNRSQWDASAWKFTQAYIYEPRNERVLSRYAPGTVHKVLYNPDVEAYSAQHHLSPRVIEYREDFYERNRDGFWRMFFVAVGPFVFFLMLYFSYGRKKKDA